MDLTYFDENINRGAESRSYSTKWLALNRRYPEFSNTDALPMWIADMDFRCPPEIIDAITERARHGIYGYTDQTLVQKFLSATAEWVKRKYCWNVSVDCGIFTPGVLPAITAAVQEFTELGDGIIIQPPVYYPFKEIINNNQRVLKENSLVCNSDGYYQIDFENLENLARDPRTKLLILCNPHNPVCRVWKREELLKIAKICKQNNILIISDEIHADFVVKGYKHIPIASLDDDIANYSITCYAPSKTFNLAGLGVSAAFIPNLELRKRLIRRISMNRLPASNVFGPLAGYVAYTQCEDYAISLMEYIENNIMYVSNRIQAMKYVTLYKPEGTYFAWLDMRGLNFSSNELYTFLYQHAKLATDFGVWFGSGGDGFTRLNLACPKDLVVRAMNQLEDAVKNVRS